METVQPTLLEQYEPQEVGMIVADPQVVEARFSPCGKWLAAGGYDAKVRVWRVDNKEPVEREGVVGHNGWVHAVAFHPQCESNQNFLYSADSWGQLRASKLTESGVEPVWQQLAAHDGWIRQIDVSPDGRMVAACATDRRVSLWDTKTGTLLKEFRDLEEDVQALRFHPQGKLLATGDAKGKLILWNVESAERAQVCDASELWMLHRLQDVGGIRAIRFNHDGTQVACGGVKPANGATVQGEPTLLVHDTATGQRQATIRFGEQKDCFLLDLHWLENNVFMAVTCGTPGTGKIVFHQQGEEKPFFESTKYPNCQSVSYHPGSKTMAVVTTNKGSNGNGRRLDKSGAYLGNNSPIYLFRLGKQEASA